MNKLTLPSNRKLIVLFLLGFVGILLGVVGIITQYNLAKRNQDLSIEITFVDPHQAVIFWKTEETTLGSLKYTSTTTQQPVVVNQTSSTPGQIHTAVIDEIPDSGIYATIHNQTDGWFFLQKPFLIIFNPETFE